MTYIAVKVDEETYDRLLVGDLSSAQGGERPIKIEGLVITSNGEVPVVGTKVELVFATQS